MTVAPYGKYIEFGWRRPRHEDGSAVDMKKMSSFVRHKPDFWSNGILVECVGYGKDEVLKLQAEKLAAIQLWDDTADEDVVLFVWNSAHSVYCLVPLSDVLSWIGGKKVKKKKFHDGNAYWAIPRSMLAPYEVPYHG